MSSQNRPLTRSECLLLIRDTSPSSKREFIARQRQAKAELQEARNTLYGKKDYTTR